MSSIALARVYQQSFEAHPYTTLAITNGVMGAFSDVIAQMTQRVVRLNRLFVSYEYSDQLLCRSRGLPEIASNHALTSPGRHASSHSASQWVRAVNMVSP